MSVCRFVSCWKRVYAMSSVFLWQNSVTFHPAPFCNPRLNLLLLQVSLDFLLLHSSPLWWKGHLLGVRSRRSYSCCLVIQSCLTLCDAMDCSTPDLPVLHHLPQLVQTHVHWAGDAIQLSCPLLSPSPPAFNLSQHQGFF